MWLPAKAGDSFALLRCKDIDIMVHGQNDMCQIGEILLELMSSHKMNVVAVCHPGEYEPTK